MAKLWKQEGQNVLLTSGKMTINDLISGPAQFNVVGTSYFNGNVGIGTNSPVSPLNVNGTSDVRVSVTESGGSTRTDLLSQTTQGQVGTQSNSPFGIMTNGITRAFVDIAGNVGIGTTNIQSKLHVAGTGSQIWLEDASAGLNGKYTAIGTNNGNMTFSRYLDNGSLVSEYMRIDSTGDVGIGTTTPTGRLHVRGTGTQNLVIAADTSGDAILDLRAEGTNSGGIYYSRAAQQLRLYGNSTDQLVINSDGNVGIGTTNPVYKFHIDTTSDHIHLTTATTGATVSDGFTIDVTGSDARLVQREAANLLLFTNSTERMRIDSAGRIHTGGQSNGTDAVNIIGSQGGISIAKGVVNALNGEVLGSLSFHSYINDSNQTNAECKIDSVAVENHTGISAASAMRFYTKPLGVGPGSSPVERMRIDPDGNVGIGTNSPADALEVFSTITARNGAGTAALRLRSDLTDMQWQALNGVNAIQLYDSGAGAERMRIDSAGNVGIGETIPLTTLHVVSATDTAQTDYGYVAFQDSLSKGLTIGYDTTNDRTFLYSRQVGVAPKPLSINNELIVNAGSVGIGDNSVTAKFMVSDGSTARYHIAPGSTTCVLHARNYANSGYVSAIYGATQHIFECNGIEAGRFSSSGNLGLGETNPTFKLESTQAVDGEHIGLLIHNSQTNAAASLNESAYLLYGFGGDKDVARIGVTKEGDYTTAGNSNSSLDFWNDVSGAVTRQMRLRSNGDLQLGLTLNSAGLNIEPRSGTSTLRYDSDKFRLFTGKTGGYQEEVAVWDDRGFLALTSDGANVITSPIYPFHVRTDSAVHNTHSFVFEIEGSKASNTAHMLVVQKNADHSFGSCLEVRCDNDTADATPDRPRIDWVGPTGNSWSWGGRANSTSDNFHLFKDGGASQGVEGSIVMEVDYTDEYIRIPDVMANTSASQTSLKFGSTDSGIGYVSNGGMFYHAEGSLPRHVMISGGTTSASFSSTGCTLQNEVKLPDIATTASGANVFVDNGNSNNILRSTSSIRYKTDITPLMDEEIDLVYKLDPMTYISLAKSDDPDKRFFGFTAEHMDEEVHSSLVNYDSEGLPDGVAYDRITVLLAAEAKRQKERADALEARLAAIESALGI